MAIFSLHHSSIGKSTQKAPFTAAAHVDYVTRPSACARAIGTRMPERPEQLRAWFNAAESQDRKNARVCDKVMLALPRELDAAQRHELVRAFAEGVTKGEAPWFAAFHDLGKDAENPHCHLIIRDRHPTTGQRVIGMSEAGSTERLREAWERECNQALELARQPARVSRLTLEAQGIEREPTIHEGVRARQMARNDKPMRSRRRSQANAAKARSRERVVDYPAIDGGTPRRIHNGQVRLRALERTMWATLDQDRLERDIETQKRVHRPDLLGQPGRDVPESLHDIDGAAAAHLGRGSRGAAGHRVDDHPHPEHAARRAERFGSTRNLSTRGTGVGGRAPDIHAPDSAPAAGKPIQEGAAARHRRQLPSNSAQLDRKEPVMGTNPYKKDHAIAAKLREQMEFEYRQVESRIHFCKVSAETYGFMPDNLKAELDELNPNERRLEARLSEVKAQERGLRQLHDEWERDNRDPDRAKAIPYEPDDEPKR
jgi:hypothetical protein